MTASILIARALGGLTAMVVLAGAVMLLVAWLRWAADVLIAAALRPRLILPLGATFGALVLGPVGAALDPVLGLVAAGALTPPLTLLACDLLAWRAEPAEGLLGAFQRRQKRLQQASYQGFPSSEP